MKGLRAMPVLGVRDVRAAAAFYRDRLGFEIAGIWSGEEDAAAGFAIVGLHRVTLALQRNGAVVPSPHWAAYIYVDDVDACHRAFRDGGVRIVRPPEDTFYGCRDMDVTDLDGHLLAFGQDLDPPPEGPGL